MGINTNKITAVASKQEIATVQSAKGQESQENDENMQIINNNGSHSEDK